MKTLKETSTQGLQQLAAVLCQLTEEEYARPLPILSGNSIGKHTRHVLTCYEQLLNSAQTGFLDYGRRQRCSLLETNRQEALRRIQHIQQTVAQLDPAQTLILEAEAALAGAEPIRLPSTVGRELLHNVEHAIHHMALIQVALAHAFSHVTQPPHFGLAYATVQHRTA